MSVIGLGAMQIACGGADGLTAAKTTGRIVVSVVIAGNGTDADGFTATIDGKSLPLTSAAPATFDLLTPGSHVVRLSGVVEHCAATPDTAVRPVTVGVSETTVFHVSCVGGIAYHEFTNAAETQIRYLGEDGKLLSLTSGPGRHFIRDWSPDGSRILFSNDVDGKDHFFLVRPDGTGLVQLTSGTSTDIRPRWSPDGTRIAFWRYDPAVVGGTSWIVVMNADGSNQHVLIDVKGGEFDPVWSPDGSKLYFSCNRFASPNTLCVAGADGSGLRKLDFPEISAATGSCPSACIGATPQHWEMSPDGRSIAFETLVSPSNGGQAIWVGDVDGSSAKVVTPGMTSFDGHWSPKGDRLLVAVTDAPNSYALATAKPDGSAYQVLTSFPNRDQSGEFSPDGTIIAFGGFQGGPQGLWTMNADGSGRRSLANTTTIKFVPRWNPKARPGGPLASGDVLPATPALSRTVSPTSRARADDPLVRLGDCAVVRQGQGNRVVCAR
jgi:TolB protein